MLGKAGIISQSFLPWLSPIVIVLKKVQPGKPPQNINVQLIGPEIVCYH